MDIITSRDNRVIKEVRSLYQKSAREEKGLFVCEGMRNVRDAFSKGARVEYVLKSEGCLCNLDFAAGVRVYTASGKIFEYASDTVTPQGVLAVCAIEDVSFKDIELGERSLLLVCENLRDPGNAGTLIRTADAVGAAGVVLLKGCVDAYSPKVVRAAMGSVFSVKIVRGKNADALFAFLENEKIKSVAGALGDGAENIFNSDMRGRCAVFIGNEGSGLTPETLKRCALSVKIPILGGAESLNASSAAAVMMYEHVRQNFKFMKI